MEDNAASKGNGKRGCGRKDSEEDTCTEERRRKVAKQDTCNGVDAHAHDDDEEEEHVEAQTSWERVMNAIAVVRRDGKMNDDVLYYVSKLVGGSSTSTDAALRVSEKSWSAWASQVFGMGWRVALLAPPPSHPPQQEQQEQQEQHNEDDHTVCSNTGLFIYDHQLTFRDHRTIALQGTEDLEAYKQRLQTHNNASWQPYRLPLTWSLRGEMEYVRFCEAQVADENRTRIGDVNPTEDIFHNDGLQLRATFRALFPPDTDFDDVLPSDVDIRQRMPTLWVHTGTAVQESPDNFQELVFVRGSQGNSSSLAVASVSWGVERRSGYAEVQVVSGGCGDGGGSGHASNDARDAMRFQFGVVRCSADGTYPEQEQLPSQGFFIAASTLTYLYTDTGMQSHPFLPDRAVKVGDRLGVRVEMAADKDDGDNRGGSVRFYHNGVYTGVGVHNDRSVCVEQPLQLAVRLCVYGQRVKLVDEPDEPVQESVPMAAAAAV